MSSSTLSSVSQPASVPKPTVSIAARSRGAIDAAGSPMPVTELAATRRPASDAAGPGPWRERLQRWNVDA